MNKLNYKDDDNEYSCVDDHDVDNIDNITILDKYINKDADRAKIIIKRKIDKNKKITNL